jgi:TolB-like protein
MVLAAGLVVVLVFSWVYELTAEGVRRESEVPREQSVTVHTARRLDHITIALVVLALGVFAADRLGLGTRDTPVTGATTVAAEKGSEKGSEAFSGGDTPVPATASVPENDSDPFSFSSATVEAAKSVAVLPFVNMSSDPEQTYFSDGISEELLNALVKLPGLKVAGRTSSFAFRDKTDDLRAIGKALNVNHILEGSVRKQGMRVRITAQLIKADDGFHVWSESYDREVTDIFALQDEITREIVRALEVELGQQPAPKSVPTASIEAYSVYLRARQKLALRGVDGLAEARDLFEQAVALDPDYAPAHSGLARAAELYFLYRSDYGLINASPADIAGNIQTVRRAAQRALALDPGNAEAWSVLGHLEVTFQGDWDDAGRGHDRALALRPNDPEILNFAGDYQYWVQDPRARATESRAAALDPMLAVNHHDLALLLAARGEYTAALASAGQAEALGFYERSPGLRTVTFVSALIGLRRYDDARAIVDKVAADPRVARGAILAAQIQIAAAQGDAPAIERLLAEFLPLVSAGEVSASVAAMALIWAGRLDEAVPWVERATQPGNFWVMLDPLYFVLPERLPDHAGLRAALDRPDLDKLFEIRRRNLAVQSGVPPAAGSGTATRP